MKYRFSAAIAVLAMFLAIVGPSRAIGATGIELRVTTASGDARAVAPLGQFTRIATAQGKAIALEVRFDAASNMYRVFVFRTDSTRDPRMLTRADFTLAEIHGLAIGGQVGVSISPGNDVSVSAGMGPPLDTSDGPKNDCTCCVTCENGVSICGCRVNSSCGSCDGRAAS